MASDVSLVLTPISIYSEELKQLKAANKSNQATHLSIHKDLSKVVYSAVD